MSKAPYRVEGSLDLANVDAFLQKMRDLLREQPEVEVDLSSLTFVDSTGVRGLLEARDMGRAAGKPLRFSGYGPRWKRSWKCWACAS